MSPSSPNTVMCPCLPSSPLPSQSFIKQSTCLCKKPNRLTGNPLRRASKIRLLLSMERGTRYGDDHDNLMATELRLGPPGANEEPGCGARGCKRPMPDAAEEPEPRVEPSAPAAKAQVVGWPPIGSHRKHSYQARRTEAGGGIYVKVSMDGAPYLRKIDLKLYKSYEELIEALEDMFKCFSSGDDSAAKDFGRSNYAVAYEDKDGDWMLVGDVPWRMFISSCKRLRIMKGFEARGLGSIS